MRVERVFDRTLVRCLHRAPRDVHDIGHFSNRCLKHLFDRGSLPPRSDSSQRVRWPRSAGGLTGRGPAAAAGTAATVAAAGTSGECARSPTARPTTAGLTPRQRKVLEVIRDAVERRGYPPSMREIGEAVGLTSTVVGRAPAGHARAQGLHPARPEPAARDRGAQPRASARRADGRAATAGRPPTYVPVVGRIAAGGPILAEQAVEDVFPLPRQLVGRRHAVLAAGGR